MNHISYQCSVCSFRLYIPIVQLTVSTLGLYDDRRYPGRCILVYHDHIENFEDLVGGELNKFIHDIQLASKAIKKAVDAQRINYAILGNAEPHLHAHLIPRNPNADDPVPKQAPWAHPEKSAPLNKDRKIEIINKISIAISELRQT